MAYKELGEGDPLPPLLFTIVVEVLGSPLQNAKKLLLINDFEVGRWVQQS